MANSKDVNYNGEYCGSDERMKNAIWFKSSHFNFGTETSGMGAHSHAKYTDHSKSGRDNQAKALNDAKTMTRTNFTMGNHQIPSISTSNANYANPPADYKPKLLDNAAK